MFHTDAQLVQMLYNQMLWPGSYKIETCLCNMSESKEGFKST